MSTSIITQQQYVILGLLIGLTGEISISGIISCLVHHARTKQTRKAGERNWTIIIMINFNLSCLFYLLNIFFDLFLIQGNCIVAQHIGNASSQYFYLSFDFFILFKSYTVSNLNIWVFRSAILVFGHRIVWTGLDLAKSGGDWDPLTQTCNYEQNAVTGIGYNGSDIIVDAFCTIVSLLFTWKLMRSKITRIADVIRQENAFAAALTVLTRKETREISTKDALLSFFDERLFLIDGASPALWDPVSGDYKIGKDYIRLHCNFSKHRAAALNAAGISNHSTATRADLQAALANSNLSASEIVARVESLGGCAAHMKSIAVWKENLLYKQLKESPLISITLNSHASLLESRRAWIPNPSPTAKPLDSLRVLDLTRVLAGPVCCKSLAAQGASVIHVSSTTIDNLGILDVSTGVGKRSVFIDLKTKEGKDKLKSLIADADVLVQAYRPGALEDLGLGPDELWTLNPRLVYATICAYGVPGMERSERIEIHERRGFDSLVQMETGICHEGLLISSANGGDGERPVPLPCQALDHATGWLTAVGILEALEKARSTGVGSLVEVSLARTSVWLESLGRKEVNVANTDSKWKDVLFADVDLEEVKVRGNKGHILKQVKNPVVFKYKETAGAVMGPPEELGIDTVDSWANVKL
ncbi:UNVERIFIED_CONTAM: hypothetical protein HDU68_006864 [Siphonaria sp. JEL0065]|nr:hypothetical protein HDU68_006864 [Siphonaria sp. JEL0065]